MSCHKLVTTPEQVPVIVATLEDLKKSRMIAREKAWEMYANERVWSPGVFAWRNFLRQPPKIEYQLDAPLLITNPRYYSFMSIGSAIGGVLRFDIINRAINQSIHINVVGTHRIKWVMVLMVLGRIRKKLTCCRGNQRKVE
jgi:hypothetical protein